MNHKLAIAGALFVATFSFMAGAILAYASEADRRRACVETHDLLMDLLDRSSKRTLKRE